MREFSGSPNCDGLYRGTTLELAEKWRISTDLEFLWLFFGRWPGEYERFY